VLYVREFHGNIPLFAYYKLCSLQLEQFRSGVAVPTLNRNSFSSELIAIPTIEEQREIADIVQIIDRKISVHERKRVALSDLFQTLLHELMTAKIRVDKLDIDTREVAALNPQS
jgi:type I restriction enzyme S subunit